MPGAQPGVLPLEDFNGAWRPAEPARLAPVYVQRVSIREALRGPLLPSLAANVELVEPTFQVRPHAAPPRRRPQAVAAC